MPSSKLTACLVMAALGTAESVRMSQKQESAYPVNNKPIIPHWSVGAVGGAVGGGFAGHAAAQAMNDEKATKLQRILGTVLGTAGGGWAGFSIGRFMGIGRCSPVTLPKTFDLESYISAPWYSHAQLEQSYQKKDELECTMAMYTKTPAGNRWDIDVSNRARTNKQNPDTKGFLCAKHMGGAKLGVAPCFLTPWMSGNYWVPVYNANEGYAIIIGGQPDLPKEDGTCGYVSRSSGMWIFSRKRERNETLVQMLKAKMKDELKLDTSRLLDVPQVGCAEGER